MERDESESLMLWLFMVEQNTYFRFQDRKFVVLYEKGAKFRSQTISVLNFAFGPIRSQIQSARFQDRSVRTVEFRGKEIEGKKRGESEDFRFRRFMTVKRKQMFVQVAYFRSQKPLGSQALAFRERVLRSFSR